MTAPALPAERRRGLTRIAFERTRLSTDELWLRCLALGTLVGPAELGAYLEGSLALADDEMDLVALAINERIDALHWRDRAPYSRPLRVLDRRGGPLAALTELLRATHLAAPDTLAKAVDLGARELGVRAVAYLVDDFDEVLVPVGGDGSDGRLDVDASLAGRAYRLVETQQTTADGPRLWVPILDGAERLGVLEVGLDDPRELDDPVLRRQCWWFTHYLGHLVTVLDAYGDSIDAIRRGRRREVQAELLRALLPPLTAGSDKVLISARLEPADAVGGDVLDYTISSDRLQLMIADATGHDLRAGLAASTALAAYRNERRSGHGLLQQALGIQDAVRDQFHGDMYATGVLGGLDLGTGVLRYINAGHPAPLLLRGGRVVKELHRGRRALFGLEARETAVAEEHLEPDDVVTFYTDGLVEARAEDGTVFGLRRFVEVLERETADELPLPEVLRRISRRLRAHGGGSLQDDATLLLVQWTTEGQRSLEPDPQS